MINYFAQILIIAVILIGMAASIKPTENER